MQRKFKNNSIVKNLKPALSYTSVRLSEAVRLRIGEEGITAVAPQTIPQLFRECCQRVPNLPALVYKRESQKPQSNNKNKQLNTWCTITYAEYERKVEKVALILLHLGLSANACICVLAHNCPEWFYVQFGALRIGAVVSGIYVTSSEEAVKYALQCSAASVCVVDDETQLAKVRVVRAQLTNLKAVILLHRTTDINLTEKEGYYLWSSLMRESYDLVLKRKLECIESEVAANQCAMLIFTSGTTGYPKAVMLSHDAIISNIKFCVEAVAHLGSRAGVTVSYLPLNHIAAQLFEVLMPLLNGDCVYFGERDLSRTL
ncbi:long-chain-fatty-acid--CoA ligase bubblegum-like [Ceratitis capitata]|uniref:long-chain-fatty-acid--CoA ligase bubblegum-like n=1 Tax=Ceratitis capitata TaxID=7213 RepID=UPI000329AA23|nr:long-chain-fatty-acid--CoA ligase bubblegum-like [Ceratitis capitata]